jgi:hypothetical protein
MPGPRTISILAFSTMAILVSIDLFLKPAVATQEQITFMQTLEEWKYPNTTPRLYGGQMSDGGNPEIQDLACKGVMTTIDSFEDVVKFYAKKTGEETGKGKVAQAVLNQDDSEERPVKVRIISAHKADTSNTLVISRGENEKETHIAWSHYRRLSKP